MDCSLPRSCVHGILQARMLEWAAIPFSWRSSWPRDQNWVSLTAGRFFTFWDTREAPGWWVPRVLLHYSLQLQTSGIFHNRAHCLTWSQTHFYFYFPPLCLLPPSCCHQRLLLLSSCSSQKRGASLRPSLLPLISTPDGATLRIHPASAHLSPCGHLPPGSTAFYLGHCKSPGTAFCASTLPTKVDSSHPRWSGLLKMWVVL